MRLLLACVLFVLATCLFSSTAAASGTALSDSGSCNRGCWGQCDGLPRLAAAVHVVGAVAAAPVKAVHAVVEKAPLRRLIARKPVRTRLAGLWDKLTPRR